MPARTIIASPCRIALRSRFEHAAASRAWTDSILVEARSAAGVPGFGEGCPRPYVTGETVETALAFVRGWSQEIALEVDGVDTLRAWEARNTATIDRNPAAFCAVEMALLDMLAREQECSVERLLGLPEVSGAFAYTAVIGDMERQPFGALLDLYCAAGFREFKVKLCGDAARDRAKFDLVGLHADGMLRVRADANNAFEHPADCVAFLRTLPDPLFALEEPLRARDIDGFRRVAEETGTRIVLDESFLRVRELQRLARSARHWIVNCRISKLGGVIRTLAAIDAARELGLDVIIGCHVGETSLLSRAALTAASYAGNVLIAQEGAFGTRLLTRDPFRPIVMFGVGGVLRVPADLAFDRQGWGMSDESAELAAPAAGPCNAAASSAAVCSSERPEAG